MLNVQKKPCKRININQVTDSEFIQSYLRKGRIVILTHLFDKLPSFSHWSPTDLITKLGNKSVSVNRSSDGIFRLDPQKGSFATPPIKIGFKDYIERISSRELKEKLYMQQVSILRDLPELKDQLKLPGFIDASQAEEINLWVGPGGNTSPLHYDQANNFFIQLYGSKSFWLASPRQFYRLYPFSCFSKARHMSKVNLNHPDFIKYPKLSKASFIKVTVNAGELLFLPAYWWHQVYSVDTTVSVNIWSSVLWKQNICLGAVHNILNKLYSSITKSK